VYLFNATGPSSAVILMSMARLGALREPATVHLGYATWDIPLSPGPGRYDILLRARSSEAFVPVSFMPLDQYMAAVTTRELVFAGLYGGILAVTLAGAVVVLTRTDRPRAILYHIGFQLSYIAYQLSRDGVLSSLLWPGNAWMVHRGYLLMTGVSLIFLQLLMLDLLEPRQAGVTLSLPTRFRPRSLQIIVPVLFIVGLVMVPDSALAAWQRAGRVLLIVILVVQLVDSGRVMVSGETFRRVRAFGVHIAVWGILAGAAKAAGVLPYAYFQYYALSGMVVESVFFIVSVYQRISHLATERSRLEAGLREADMALLQSRGRPHFLANTFTMIRSMMRNNPTGSEEAFSLLVNDFRFFTDNVSSPLIALGDELAYIENYLAIMRLRFDSDMTVDLSFAPVDRIWLIPPLSLQPLVENAMHHAVEPVKSPGGTSPRLIIRLEVSGNMVGFSVSNPCDTPDTERFPPGTTHDNIMARMRYYHPDATLSLSVSGGVFIAVLRWSA
jgi:hypothetical protein